MAILKDLIVHGSSRFLNKIYASEIQTPLIEAEAGTFKKLKADDATVIGLLDVKGQLHTNSWSNSNIATIDGSFYITPTIGSASGTVTITASSLVFSGTNYAVSSLYLGDGSSITWPQYSKVLVTGQILSNGEWIPLGTLLGQLSSTATAASININNIKDNKNQTSNVLATLVSEGITSSSYRNLKVSLYQRASSSTTFYPLGIYMTATGTNGRTFLDIYGGVEVLSSNNNYGGFAEPNVRIGNLQGLPNVGGQTPSGWGIYTDNGYFKGIIAADKGYIGAGSKYWVIANEDDVVSRSYIYNGTNSITSTEKGIYLGTDGIRNYKDANTYVNITEGVITAKGVNLTGEITATSGTIAGWTIKQNYLVTGDNSGPGANILMLNGNGTTGSYTIAGTASTGWMITAGTTFGINKNGGVYATSGKIGSWILNTNGFYITNNIPGYNANTLVISKGTASTKAIGGSDTTSKNWMISAGTGFGVTTAGVLYANNVHISGEITATSGTIGGIQLDNNGKLWIKDANISGTISSKHIDVSSISIGSLSGASNYAQKSYVDDAVNDIEIGGRNLIWNSNFQLPINGNWANWGLASTTREVVTINGENWIHIVTTADAFQGYQQSQTNRNGFGQIQAGDKIIFSYDAYSKIEGQKGCIGIHWRDSNDINISQSWTSFDLTTTKKRYITPVFTVPTNAVGFNIMIGQNIAAAQEIWITNIKGEKGNKATDWTPALEDTQESINIVQVNTNAINLSPYFSYSPYVINNYWKIFNVHNGYTFTDMGDGWVRIQYTNTGSSVVRRDFAPKFNREIKEGTDYTWLIEFRNNYSTGTSTGTDFYLVEANNCQFWGGVIKENLEGSGTGSATFPISYVPTGSSEVYRKRFVKTSEATGSTHWTDGSADNLIGLACFTARCAANTTIDYEVRVSVYEGRYLGDYKPYIDSSAGNVANTALGQSVWYAECPTAAGTAVKVATISPVTTDFVLTKGVTVNVKFTNTNSATNSSLQLNVNGTGAKNIKYIYNGTYTNIVAGYLKANQMYQFRYDGTYWIVQMMYNTNNYDRSQYAVSLYASEAISSARIAVLGLDGKLHILNSSSFNISCPLLYVGTTYSADDVTKLTARASNYTYWGASFNLTNTHSIQSAAANTNVYIVGTLSGNIFTPSTTVLTCAEPTTEDGLYYMLLGRMTSTTNAVLQAEHPIYIYKNGNFQKLEATTATSYITYIDANNGIRVHNESDSNNFLQLNSTAISIYRNNNINNAAVEVLRLDNNGIRIGKVNENNVFIDNDSVDIRNGQTILSSFGNNIITLGELNKSRLELTVGSITGISSQGIENFKIIGNSEEANTIQETGDINNLSILEDYNFDGTVFKGYFTPSVNLSNYESVTILIEYQIDDINRSYTFSFTPNSTSSELIPPTQELNNSTIYTREYLDITEGYCFIIKDVNKINEIEDASNIDFDPNGTTLPENSSYHFTVSDSVTYSITVRTLQHYDSSFTFGSRVNSSVIGSNSCTIGEELIANLPNQVAIGRYNENNSNNSYAFMIGNGIHGVSRRNAFSVDWNGNTKTGNLYTTGNIETNGSLKSKYFNCNGNANITGSLNIGSLTIANKIPIKAISHKFNYTLGPNVSASDSRNVNLTGYTAIGIISFGVFNAENGNPSQNVPSGIIKRCYLWGGENQLLDIDVWNKNMVESANFTVYVKVLYVQWSLF